MDAAKTAILATAKSSARGNACGVYAARTFAESESNRAKTFPRPAPRARFAAAVYRPAIIEKLDTGLSLQRIWQDLVEEYGYGASYESVKRFVRTIAPKRRAVGVFHCAPGAEGQIDGVVVLGVGLLRKPTPTG